MVDMAAFGNCKNSPVRYEKHFCLPVALTGEEVNYHNNVVRKDN